MLSLVSRVSVKTLTLSLLLVGRLGVLNDNIHFVTGLHTKEHKRKDTSSQIAQQAANLLNLNNASLNKGKGNCTCKKGNNNLKQNITTSELDKDCCRKDRNSHDNGCEGCSGASGSGNNNSNGCNGCNGRNNSNGSQCEGCSGASGSDGGDGCNGCNGCNRRNNSNGGCSGASETNDDCNSCNGNSRNDSNGNCKCGRGSDSTSKKRKQAQAALNLALREQAQAEVRAAQLRHAVINAKTGQAVLAAKKGSAQAEAKLLQAKRDVNKARKDLEKVPVAEGEDTDCCGNPKPDDCKANGPKKKPKKGTLTPNNVPEDLKRKGLPNNDKSPTAIKNRLDPKNNPLQPLYDHYLNDVKQAALACEDDGKVKEVKRKIGDKNSLNVHRLSLGLKFSDEQHKRSLDLTKSYLDLCKYQKKVRECVRKVHDDKTKEFLEKVNKHEKLNEDKVSVLQRGSVAFYIKTALRHGNFLKDTVCVSCESEAKEAVEKLAKNSGTNYDL